ncbi:MAG: hypothetical protein ACRD2A_22780, partial [Vicinamibacterales bacterium]
LQPQTHERVSRGGVRLLSRLALPPGRYQIHVGAYEATGSTTGTVPYDIEVPDYAKSPLGLSGVLLTSSQADLLVTPNPDPMLKDILPASPVARRRFSAAETLTVYAEVYDNSSQGRAIAIATTVLDANDGRKVFEATDRRAAQPSVKVQGFTTELPLKGLSQGTYVLRVEASAGAGGPSARRDVLFEVQ